MIIGSIHSGNPCQPSSIKARHKVLNTAQMRKNSAHVAWSKRVAQDCSARCGADFAAGVKLFLLRGRWKTPQAVIL